MKIAFVNDGIYEYASGASEAVGGLERDQWLLARALVAAGWSTTVGVRGPLRSGQRRVIEGVEYVGLPTGQVLRDWHGFMRSERPDWLFWEGASHLWGPVVALARLTGVRTVFHTAFDSDVDPRRALFRRQRWWRLYAWGLKRTDKILVQHRGQLEALPSRLRARTVILPKVCHIKTGAAGGLPPPQTCRGDYVAWVAMLRQPKRPDLLVEIARKSPNVRFVVCGGPTRHRSPEGYGERIVQALRTSPNIDYRGQVSPAAAMEVIRNAAMLLSTSDEEGFPNTFTQAWSVGTPVISLKIDPDDVIKQLGLGIVAGSVDDAVDLIESLRRSPKQREDMGSRAQRYVTDVHSDVAVTAVIESALGGDSQKIQPTGIPASV